MPGSPDFCPIARSINLSMHTPITRTTSAADLRIAVVASRYHAEVTDALRDGAVSTFLDSGGEESNLLVIPAPGSFELVSIAAAIARRGEVDAIVTIGCVITGETPHDQYICSAVSNGLAQISVETGVPVAFGVLTCQTMGQARNRAGGRQGNKGEEAMTAAIEAAGAIRQVREVQFGRRAERSGA